MTNKTLTIEQIGSPIGRPKDQRQTLVGLGLNKMRRRRTLEDTPAVRGMVRKGKEVDLLDLFTDAQVIRREWEEGRDEG